MIDLFVRLPIRFSLTLLLLFLFCLQPLTAGESRLTQQDVRRIMEQLFTYHVDNKTMTPLLLERSLKIYLKQFDPTSAYFLQQEAAPYLQPSKSLLKEMLSDYGQDHFPVYFALNQQIQESILRARSWRSRWQGNPKQLIRDAHALAFKESASHPTSFASSLEELEQVHYLRFLEFLAMQLQMLDVSSTEGKEAKIVALCEKQLLTLENRYLGIGEQNRHLEREEEESFIVLRILQALAHSLDAHTAYYSREEAEAIKTQLEKGMCGIGVLLREGLEGIVIQDLVTGGPAEQSGVLKRGDTIIEIDGQSITELCFPQVMDLMRGKEGTKTTLGVVRTPESPQQSSASAPAFFRVELVRAKITLGDHRVDVESEPFGDGVIGKITLHSFYEGEDGVSSEKDLKAAIDQLRAEGPLYGLVLDMRENNGGFLSQAVRVSGLFVSNGVVVVSKYSDGSMKYYRTVEGARYYDGPLVVLISRGSASATEIVAQTLQDYGVALIIGDEQTYGKGTIQHQTITNDQTQSFFKVTVGRYYTVSGKSTQIEGVKADILVPSELNFAEMGEGYLEYPLSSDGIAAVYQDSLEDLDPWVRSWFRQYYLPGLQHKENQWTQLLPLLRTNSERRLQKNPNFQHFLQAVTQTTPPNHPPLFGSNDLQLEEAVNIVKDMIFFAHPRTLSSS